jgi:2-polyprenyl-3-methyl-5-hydroxy-6-metoxy-1,4-benzoquinol methylase
LPYILAIFVFDMTKIDENLFRDEHYLGRPADLADKIVSRRIELTREIPRFFDKELELIEIGCGNGASISLIAGEIKSALGTDINNDHELEFKQFNNAFDNVAFQVLNIEKDLPSKKYDRLLSFEVIEHLLEEKSVANYALCLKDGGEAVISVPNKWWIFEIHGAKIPGYRTKRVPFLSWMPRFIHEPLANARIYSKPRIKKLMEDSGFEVKSMQYITAPLDVLKESSFKRFMLRYFFNSATTHIPFMSVSILVHAVKK